MFYLHISRVNDRLHGDVRTVKALEQPFVWLFAQERRELAGGHVEQLGGFGRREKIAAVNKGVVIIGLGLGFGQFRLEGFGSGQ